MTALAPYLCDFLREYLPRDRRASPHTSETYAHAFRLLVCFAADRLKAQPSTLQVEQLDAPMILAFLHHLETERGNGPKTRNARLAAINAFFRYLEYRLVSSLDESRSIHSIPIKKADDKLIDYLTRPQASGTARRSPTGYLQWTARSGDASSRLRRRAARVGTGGTSAE